MQALADTHTALLRVHKELEALKRLSEVAVAAAAYGVDKSDTVARSQRLVERAASLQKVALFRCLYHCTNRRRDYPILTFAVRISLITRSRVRR